jgi:hypothetical protein
MAKVSGFDEARLEGVADVPRVEGRRPARRTAVAPLVASVALFAAAFGAMAATNYPAVGALGFLCATGAAIYGTACGRDVVRRIAAIPATRLQGLIAAGAPPT